MFILGMFWKRTTGTAAIVGVIAGFVLSVFFNEFAPVILGNETLLYTAWPNGKGGYEIPFHICMGLSFVFTMLLMIAVSFAGPKINPKAFDLDPEMFKIKPQTTVMIVITLLIIFALYAKFW
jgi:SSS family solute:Na+ symporter